MDLTKANWKDVEPKVWKYENKGDQIAGILVRVEPPKGDTSARYYVQNDAGTFLIFGTAVLQARMACVETGNLVRIKYEGTELNAKNQKIHIFKVETASAQAGESEAV